MSKLSTAILLVVTLLAAPTLGEAPGAVESKTAEEHVIARVLGEPITADQLIAVETEFNRKKMSAEEFAAWRLNSRKKLLMAAVRTPLLTAYAKREGLMPTERERKAYAAYMLEAGKQNQSALDAEGQKQIESLWLTWAEAWIIEWRTAHSLWNEHGGSLGMGSLGSCVAFEAEHHFLKKEIEAGRLLFEDKEIEKMFWQRAANKQQRADSVIEDQERIAQLFEEQFAHYLSEEQDLGG